MKFENESILTKINERFGNFRKGFNKLNGKYPDISFSKRIDDILIHDELFPLAGESPTGWSINILEDIYIHPSQKEVFFSDVYGLYIGKGPFTNEEWTSLILNKSYAFPDIYRKDSRIIQAIQTTLEIQAGIITTEKYKKVQSERRTIGIDSLKKYPHLENMVAKYMLPTAHTTITNPNFLRCMIEGCARRIDEIIYSSEEQKFRDLIQNNIAFPLEEVEEEIREKIQKGEVFE